MCTFSEALIEKGELRGETKGTIKGILQGKADSVLQLVKNHIASNIEQAMDMLSVDEKMRSDIERILENRERGLRTNSWTIIINPSFVGIHKGSYNSKFVLFFLYCTI